MQTIASVLKECLSSIQRRAKTKPAFPSAQVRQPLWPFYRRQSERQYEVISNLAFLSKTPGRGRKVASFCTRMLHEEGALKAKLRKSSRPLQIAQRTNGWVSLSKRCNLDVVNLVAREIASSNALTPATADQLRVSTDWRMWARLRSSWRTPCMGLSHPRAPDGPRGAEGCFRPPAQNGSQIEVQEPESAIYEGCCAMYLNLNYAGGVGQSRRGPLMSRLRRGLGRWKKAFNFPLWLPRTSATTQFPESPTQIRSIWESPRPAFL